MLWDGFVDDKAILANYIFVTKYLVDMVWNKTVLGKKGESSCLVVEHLEDIPTDEERDRLWINVASCKVIN